MELASVAFTLFLVMDPLGNIPMFLSALKEVPAERRRRVLDLHAHRVVMQHRRRAERERSARVGSIVHAAEQQQRRVDARGAQRGHLGDRRDGEARAPFAQQTAGDRSCAAAVSIRLHHGDHFAIAREATRDRRVVRERGEVDHGACRARVGHAGDSPGGFITHGKCGGNRE
jgi:hypothetical protein